jgi:hypothetical protein
LGPVVFLAPCLPGFPDHSTKGVSGKVQLFGGAGHDVLLSGPRNDLLDEKL